ncbi:hypothetical protein SAMN04488066_101291 [Halorubrum aquaticum]|uniref:t-SNARE coiled-coil homology domain-containing protein n=1 Tax=Halorubrum aquaticum TaxID=387340 RepID=A0A1I2Z6Q0_9EURY|nr:hypothetical protein [Halorubrum aquaticum]SFH33532.1 hypothetical protein SAMN04488066_101291 [Halorubrum aquaticum]
MNERTTEATTTVEEDGVRVEKSFTDDAFPVPAVTFDLSSRREDAVRVRIVDRIPEEFPMDRVGFHPDYESENWTAYKDHRVEFERVLEPGESVETVFGIRDDDPDLDGFLGTPVIEHVPVGEEIGDVLGTGETDAVREVLSGDRATLPGMEDAPEADRDATDDEDDVTDSEDADDADTAVESTDDTDAVADPVTTPEPRSVDDGTTAAVTRRKDAETAESVEDADDEADADVEPTEDAEPAEGVESAGDGESDEDGEPDTDATAASAPQGGIAAALAEEIRSGAVEEEDMEVLRSELDLGVPRSVDVRISRLQSSVADIEAYADALAEFIDEEGTAKEVLDGLDARVDEVESTVESLDTRVTAGERAHGELSDDVEAVETTVDEVEASVETVETTTDDLSETVGSVEDDLAVVREDVDGVETTVEDLEETVSAVQATTHGLEETVEGVAADVTSLEADIAGLDDALDDVDDDVETLYEEVDDAAAGIERTDERVDEVEDRFGRFDEEFDDLWDDLAEVDSRLTDIEGRLGDDLEDVETEISEINDHLEELEAFRKRLNEAFGP